MREREREKERERETEKQRELSSTKERLMTKNLFLITTLKFEFKLILTAPATKLSW